jgi:hypothetical protein
LELPPQLNGIGYTLTSNRDLGASIWLNAVPTSATTMAVGIKFGSAMSSMRENLNFGNIRWISKKNGRTEAV